MGLCQFSKWLEQAGLNAFQDAAFNLTRPSPLGRGRSPTQHAVPRFFPGGFCNYRVIEQIAVFWLSRVNAGLLPTCNPSKAVPILYGSMRIVGLRKVRLVCAVLVALVGIGSAASYAATMSADEIIQKAVHRSQLSSKETKKSAFTYTKVNVTEEFDSSGKVKERKEKVYEVSFRDGASRLRLLEVNGHAPSDSDLKKLAENESSYRLLTGKSKADKKDNHENFLTPELVARFNFTLIGQAPINGRTAYEISFRPKNPPPATHHVLDRLLDRLSGTLWIDTEEYETARADIQLGSEVTLLGGVIGSLKKLAYTMTRTRVADGVWLNTYSSGDFEGRKLIDSMRIKTKSESRDFKPVRIAS